MAKVDIIFIQNYSAFGRNNLSAQGVTRKRNIPNFVG